jgi:hypothetical protein
MHVCMYVCMYVYVYVCVYIIFICVNYLPISLLIPDEPATNKYLKNLLLTP